MKEKLAVGAGCCLLILIIEVAISLFISWLVWLLWGYFLPQSQPPYLIVFLIVIAISFILTWIGNTLRGGK